MKELSEDHYIIMDDSEIKVGDWYYLPRTHNIYQCKEDPTELNLERRVGIAKITYSTQPESLGVGWMQSVLPILLSEVKELLGEVDVEKKALEISPIELDEDEFDVNETHRVTWIDGYNQALEDNKEKKYTRNEVHALMCKAFEQGLKKADVLEAGLEGKETDVECAWILTRHDSTPKTEWEVEMVDGKLKLKS